MPTTRPQTRPLPRLPRRNPGDSSAPLVRFDLASLMTRHGVTLATLATRLGCTEYRVRELRDREFWTLEDTRHLFAVVTGGRTATTDTPTQPRYKTIEIVATSGEVKTYRAFPHHARGTRKWALWQRTGGPVYTVTAPDYGPNSRPRIAECHCTCPAYEKADPNRGCKHVISLMENWMI